MKIDAKEIGIFIITFIIAYLIIGFTFWFTTRNSNESYYQKTSKAYIQKHTSEIKNHLFDTLFTKAQLCRDINKQPLKKLCEDNIRHQLAVLIIEEDFLNSDGQGWPTDLFFVKQVGNTFLRLGWDGKLEDITQLTSESAINSSLPYAFKLITGACRPFEIVGKYPDSCLVYVPIELNNNEIGYVVRRAPTSEEDNFFWWQVENLLFLTLVPIAILMLKINSTTIFMMTIVGITIILPIAIAFIVMMAYSLLKRESLKKAKKLS